MRIYRPFLFQLMPALFKKWKDGENKRCLIAVKLYGKHFRADALKGEQVFYFAFPLHLQFRVMLLL